MYHIASTDEEFLQIIQEMAKTKNKISVMANTSALIYHYLDDINWVGYYLLDENAKDEEALKVGPFQGLPACEVICLGKGVCGQCAVSGQAIIVPDVSKFEGHIACDANSKSELVVPLLNKEGDLLGVLDIDSPVLNRFGQRELDLVQAIAKAVTGVHC